MPGNDPRWRNGGGRRSGPDGVEASVPAIEFLSDKSLVGTYYGSGDSGVELPELAELALSGKLDLEAVVSHVEPSRASRRPSTACVVARAHGRS